MMATVGHHSLAAALCEVMDHSPFEPMEARLVDELPAGEGWQFEPKWDGFRCLAVKRDGAVALFAKSGKPLGRYFPDVVSCSARSRRTISCSTAS